MLHPSGSVGPDPTPPVRLRLVRVHVPLVQVHRSAHGEEGVRDVVLVEWTRPDGVRGWGECPTLGGDGYVTGSTDRAWRQLATELAPAAIAGQLPVTAGAMAAAGALRDADLDASLRAHGVGLAAHLGARRRRVARTVVLAEVGGDLDQLVVRARRAVEGGARMLKVKVVPGADVAPLRAVSSAVAGLGTEPVGLAADANGSYAEPEQLRELDALGLAYVEQPFAPGATWSELAELHSSLRTPVALDESLTSPDAVRDALLAGAVDVVSVKPARLGGIVAAASAVDLAASHGRPAFVGGMLELGIGRAGAAAVAALAGCTLPTDLGPSSAYVREDVTDPITTDPAGDLTVPDGPGLGRAPDPGRLAQATVDEVVLGR